jgi:hypothetical protein
MQDDRPHLMSDRDWTLSMFISRRPDRPELEALRTMLLHRLRPATKAVLRRPLRPPNHGPASSYGMFCEACRKWTHVDAVVPAWTCPGCERHYEAETVIYSEVVQPRPTDGSRP